MEEQVLDLSQLKLSVIEDPEEVAYAQDLLARHHYLGSRHLRREHLLHAVEFGGQWVALVLWQEVWERFSLRDRAIGWGSTEKQARLQYVVQNVRFLVLPEASGIKNLASKALSLSTSELSREWQKRYKHPVFVAETFVDPRYFNGTCYRASGWEYIGDTRGNRSRDEETGKYLLKNPKYCFHKKLHKEAYEILSAPFPHPLLSGAKLHQSGSDNTRVLNISTLDSQSLKAALEQVPDPRSAHGRRYDFLSILTLTVLAVLAGQSGYKQIHQWVEALPRKTREKIGLRYGKWLKYGALRNILKGIDGETLDHVVCQWLLSQQGLDSRSERKLIALDGKVLRGSKSPQNGTKAVQLLSAITHELGITIAQRPVSSKTNEIPIAQKMIEQDLPMDEHTVVTADAMHTQTKTVDVIIKKKAILPSRSRIIKAICSRA